MSSLGGLDRSKSKTFSITESSSGNKHITQGFCKDTVEETRIKDFVSGMDFHSLQHVRI